MRDYRRLVVFKKADALLFRVHSWSATLPPEERYVLKAQIRRAALSIPANIVEGSARLGEGEYIQFLNVALGSSAELEYLLITAGRFYPELASDGKSLPNDVAEVSRMLVALIDNLRAASAKSPKARPTQRLKPGV